MGPKANEPELVFIPRSPWSRRVTWAFFATKLPYKKTEYAVGGTQEYYLRWRLGAWTGKLTLPVLFTETGVLRESWEMAQWVNEHAPPESPVTLIPAAHAAQVKEWNDRADTITNYWRHQMFKLLLIDRASRRTFRQMVAPGLANVGAIPLVGGFLDGLADALFVRNIRAFLAKYTPEGEAATEEKALAALRALSEALRGGQETVLPGGLTYADIALATALDRPFKLGSEPRSPKVVEATDALTPWVEALFTKYYPQRQEGKGPAAK